jgi:hypothetical protein
LLSAACTTPPPPERPRPDPATEAWYAATLEELQGLVRQAQSALNRKDLETAGDLVTQGQPLSERLLTAPRPTLPAMKAVSDLDQLYGELLLRKRHHGWARLLIQKDVARWKNWRPQTEETLALLKRAEDALNKIDEALLR